MESCPDGDSLTTAVNDLLSDSSASGVTHWSAVCLATAALHNFVRINWTTSNASGQNDNEASPKIHPEALKSVLVDGVNGESLDVSVRRPELLCLARILLCTPPSVSNAFQDDWVVQWWKVRTLAIHFKVSVIQMTQHFIIRLQKPPMAYLLPSPL